jgi:hypothetical protein
METKSRKVNNGLKKSRTTRGKVINMGMCNGKGLPNCQDDRFPSCWVNKLILIYHAIVKS